MSFGAYIKLGYACFYDGFGAIGAGEFGDVECGFIRFDRHSKDGGDFGVDGCAGVAELLVMTDGAL